MTIARTLQKLQPYLIASADSLTYENEATTGTTIKAALDWVLAALYPNTQDSVDIPADLPLVGNTLNDYRVVLDDGDGKAAGYRWEQREGDASPGWHKIHDMDWSSDAILSAFEDIAHELYVFKYGRTDTDDSGNPITGLYAGQTIYGGNSPGQNLTLNANSGDGTGAESGYVQSDNDIRPTSDNALDLGTITERFRNLFLTGTISDGTNAVDVLDLQTAVDHVSDLANPHDTGYDNLSNKLGVLTVDGDASGTVDLSASGYKTLTVTIADNSHDHTASNISDLPEAIYDNVDAILQDSDTITWARDDGTNQLTPVVQVDTADITDIGSPATHSILGSNPAGDAWIPVIGQINLTGGVTGGNNYDSDTGGWSISTTVTNVGLGSADFIDADALTFTSVAGNPTVVTANDHGIQTGETVTIYGNELDGVYTATRIDANTFSVAVNTVGADSGTYIPQYAQLLWEPATEKFLVAKVYEQINHSEIGGLTTGDDHTQYVAKDGRSSGQTIKGGVAASENLILESTGHGTKGTVQTADTFTPATDAAYSGGWSGKDLGSTTKRFNDLHMAGEAKGLRAENLGTLPSNSGQKIGRMVFVDGLPYWDTGSEWVSGGGAGGGVATVTTPVANHSMASGELALCSGTFTVSLPDCAGFDPGEGVVYIKNIGTGTISIDPFSSQTIDGSTLVDIVDQYACLHLVTDGANWFIV